VTEPILIVNRSNNLRKVITAQLLKDMPLFRCVLNRIQITEETNSSDLIVLSHQMI
jgi:hypothetical protein